MVWEISQIYRHSSTTSSAFTPTPTTLLSSHKDRVISRDPQSLLITKTWKLPIPPASIDSTAISLSVSPVAPNYILAHAAKLDTAWILHWDANEPVARIDVGAEGAVAMRWSGTGDAVMVWSGDTLRLSIHRLAAPTQPLHIYHPKFSAPLGYTFRPIDSRYLALVERHSGKDQIGIYDAVSWKLLRHFSLPSPTADVADLAWSPCGRYIAIWETLTDYILHIYTPDGRLLSTFAPYASLSTPSGSRSTAPAPAPAVEKGHEREKLRLEKSTEAWVGLGIRCVRWHPSGDWCAVGGWDGKIRVLTRMAWCTVAELSHPGKIVAPVHVWREPVDWIEKTRGQGIVAFEPQALPFQPTSVRPDMGKPNPRMGVSEMVWSDSGNWLASYNQTYPTLIWIFNFISLSPSPSSTSATVPHFRPRLHSVLSLQQPPKSFIWKPIHHDDDEEDTGAPGDEGELLAIVTGEKGFVTWRSPSGGESAEMIPAEGVGIPARTEFAPTWMQFSKGGDALLLADRETFAVAYPVKEGALAVERSFIEGED